MREPNLTDDLPSILFAFAYTGGIGWLIGWPLWVNIVLGVIYGISVKHNYYFFSYWIGAVYLFSIPVHFLDWPAWIGIAAGLFIGTVTVTGMISRATARRLREMDSKRP